MCITSLAMPGDDAVARATRRLAEVEQLAGVGCWEVDVDTRRAEWSGGQWRLYGLDPGGDVTYPAWLDLVHPEDRETVDATIRVAVERGGDFGFDHRFHCASDGAERWARCRGRVVRGPDGTPTRIFGISLDITAERTAASTLTDFLSNAAHELRTPSAAIAQAVRTLDLVEGTDRDAVLDILVRQANRLQSLTANLVDLARAEAGAQVTKLEPVELAAAVADAAVNAPAPEGRTLATGGVPAGLAVRADRTAFDRVLVNLLTNAWRYGGPNVAVAAAPAADGTVELTVADDGEGVPAAIRDSVFDAFQRGAQRHPEASGLGLAIVDRLVRRMGGTARYEERVGGGAVFVIQLEAAR